MVRIDHAIAKVDDLVTVIIVLGSDLPAFRRYELTSQCRAFGSSWVKALSSCMIAWL